MVKVYSAIHDTTNSYALALMPLAALCTLAALGVLMIDHRRQREAEAASVASAISPSRRAAMPTFRKERGRRPSACLPRTLTGSILIAIHPWRLSIPMRYSSEALAAFAFIFTIV